MRITHTEAVCLLREVTGAEKALVQQIIATVDENYLTNIRNKTTDFINDNLANVLTHLQDYYG